MRQRADDDRRPTHAEASPDAPGVGLRSVPLVLTISYLVALALLVLSSVIDFRNARDVE